MRLELFLVALAAALAWLNGQVAAAAIFTTSAALLVAIEIHKAYRASRDF